MRYRVVVAVLMAAVAAAAIATAGRPAGAGGARTGTPRQPGYLPPTMERTELRPPPGGQPGEVPMPYDVNDEGDVVGESGGRAVLWRDGQPTVLPGGENGERAVATQIDNRGRVYVDVVEGGAYRWEDGEVTPIETPERTANVRVANDEGAALVAFDGLGNAVYGLWDDGVFTAIPSPDGTHPFSVYDLSGAGHVTVGTAGFAGPLLINSLPWLWYQGRYTLLSFTWSQPVAVNRSGHVVGRLADGTGAVLWRDGLELPVGLRPTDVNDRDQIVGSRRVGEGGAWHAFRWDDGVLTDLGEVGPDLGPFPLRPYGPITVNDAGHALGLRQEASGRVRYTLWAGGYAIDLGPAGGRDAVPVLQVVPLALSDRGHVVLSELGDDGALQRAVLWTMTYPGDPAPPDQTCVLANNWAHVRDRRAVSYLVYVWAAGTGQYLGTGNDTTALRRTGTDAWSRVDDGC